MYKKPPEREMTRAEKIFWAAVSAIAVGMIIYAIISVLPDQVETCERPHLLTYEMMRDAMVSNRDKYDLTNNEINILMNWIEVANHTSKEGYDLFYEIHNSIGTENGLWTLYLYVPDDAITMTFGAYGEHWNLIKLEWPNRYLLKYVEVEDGTI